MESANIAERNSLGWDNRQEGGEGIWGILSLFVCFYLTGLCEN